MPTLDTPIKHLAYFFSFSAILAAMLTACTSAPVTTEAPTETLIPTEVPTSTPPPPTETPTITPTATATETPLPTATATFVTIQGVVYRADLSDGLEGYDVTLRDSSQTELDKVSTDSAGEFIFTNLTEGNYSITASRQYVGQSQITPCSIFSGFRQYTTKDGYPVVITQNFVGYLFVVATDTLETKIGDVIRLEFDLACGQ